MILDPLPDEQLRMVQHEVACISLHAGMVRMSAPESLDLLHRISTNSTIDIPLDHSRSTVLTTEKGRIVDRIIVVHQAGELLLLTGTGRGGKVGEWLKKFIITEDIEVDDVTPAYPTLFVFGSNVLDWMQSSFGIPPVEEERVGRSVMFDRLIAVRDMLWPVPAYHLVFPLTVEPLILSTAALQRSIISPEVFSAVRINYAVPAAGSELIEEVNPLEAGLTPMVSFTKGCYVGQEVIARVDAYGKLQKKLAHFIVEPPVDATFLPGARLSLGGSESGYLTSAAAHADNRGAVAMGFLRTNVEGKEFRVTLRDNRGEAICRLAQ